MKKVLSWLTIFLIVFALFSTFSIKPKLILHASVNEYWVATSGNNSNSGTSSGSPWLTISHAISAANLSGGALIHVKAGTYTENISCGGYGAPLCINRSGTGPSTPLTVQCDDFYTVPTGGGCLLRNSGTSAGIVLFANNVAVTGFDYTNPNQEGGIVNLCNPGSQTSGQCPLGNNNLIGWNYMHDIAQNVNDSLGGFGCPAFGMIFVGWSRHNTGLFQTGTSLIGNRLANYGNQSSSKKNGGKCNYTQAIYVNTPNILVAYNIVIQSIAYGIQYYSAPCNGAIIGNTVDQSGEADIIVGGADCGQGPLTIQNNVLTATGTAGGIYLGASGVAPCSSSKRIKLANNLFGAGKTQLIGSLNGCTDVSGSLSESPSTTFQSYSGSTINSNYQLKSDSQAIGTGTTGCAAGVTISCIGTLDAAQNGVTNPPSRGAYMSGGSPPPPPPPPPSQFVNPTSITFPDTFSGFTSSFQPITVTNSSGSTVTISSIAASTHFGTVTSPLPCPIGGGGLAPSVSCEIDATFSPNATGQFTGTITVTDTFTGSPHVIALSGNGIVPSAPSAPTGVTVTVH